MYLHLLRRVRVPGQPREGAGTYNLRGTEEVVWTAWDPAYDRLELLATERDDKQGHTALRLQQAAERGKGYDVFMLRHAKEDPVNQENRRARRLRGRLIRRSFKLQRRRRLTAALQKQVDEAVRAELLRPGKEVRRGQAETRR